MSRPRAREYRPALDTVNTDNINATMVLGGTPDAARLITTSP
jgi:hypothetical protein